MKRGHGLFDALVLGGGSFGAKTRGGKNTMPIGPPIYGLSSFTALSFHTKL